jgi:transposase InsO family protein
LVLENLALRQQLAVLRKETPRPAVRTVDRVFWVALSRLWPRWKEALHLVKPETVIAWHRAGFRLFWTWRSRPSKGGRPPASEETQRLVRQLAADNPGWGAPRIHGELRKLGLRVAQSTVASLLLKVRGPPGPRKPPSQTWRAFLKNHLTQAAAMDFFVIPTAGFKLLYGFVIIEHGRRRIRHVAVTTQPTAAWVSQQLREACPFDTAPAFLHRDRDGIYSEAVSDTIKAMGIEEVLSAPRSPWQNPYCERVIGTLRRELFDHVIVTGEAHALALLKEYVEYYNGSRTHLSLVKDAPNEREVELPSAGPVHVREVLGGLHHRYFRRAA